MPSFTVFSNSSAFVPGWLNVTVPVAIFSFDVSPRLNVSLCLSMVASDFFLLCGATSPGRDVTGVIAQRMFAVPPEMQ